jgi:hypothetical protein
MSKEAIFQYSALQLLPVTLQTLTLTLGRTRPAFNVVVSNVPGPQQTMYFRGAGIEASYPLSIPFHGYGLNITTLTSADRIGFGYLGCRDTIPHLQRLALHGTEALGELERLAGA